MAGGLLCCFMLYQAKSPRKKGEPRREHELEVKPWPWHEHEKERSEHRTEKKERAALSSQNAGCYFTIASFSDFCT